jgi:SAM-dependent methyltransferase
MNPNQALWEQGDFTRIAASMRGSGEALVRKVGIAPGMRVLDLGCGDGTTAIPAAQLGAQVLGVDIASNLVAAGNQRAQQAGLAGRCRFLQGDACELAGVENDSFDRVLSIFGAMFAPRPFDVAREMVRVTRRGGRIVMGNWIPNDPTLVAQILKTSAAYSPPPPEGFVSPMTWGVESHVRERFGQAASRPTRSPASATPTCSSTWARPSEVRRHLPAVLRTDDERLRRRAAAGPRRRPATGAGGAVRKPEPEPVSEHRCDPGHLPAGDGGGGLNHWAPGSDDARGRRIGARARPRLAKGIGACPVPCRKGRG